MKKCGYCAKEISYNDMYCCESCEEQSKLYYEKRSKNQKLLSTMNIIGTCAIAFGIFLYALDNFIGALLLAIGGLSVGIITLVLPTPTDNLIEKFKLEKAVRLVRILGIVLLAFGIAATVLTIIKI